MCKQEIIYLVSCFSFTPKTKGGYIHNVTKP